MPTWDQTTQSEKLEHVAIERIEYDQKADALYLAILDNEIAETRPVSEYCYVDLHQGGKIVGVELLFASKTGVVGPEELEQPIQIKLAS